MHRLRLCIFLLLTLVLTSSCDQRRTYDVQGRIAGFGDDGRTLIVEHGDVPGLMPAMTMPFSVSDTSGMGALAARDAVSFTLVISGDSSWIRDIRILPDTALAEHPAGSPDVSFGPAPQILEVGDPVPQTELTTHADTTVRLSEFEGRAVLLTFIYTQCPMPDYCPLMSQQFAGLQPILQQRYDDGVHLLSISFDPENDTPDELAAYAKRYTDDLDNWTFATADSADIDTFTRQFGEFYTREGSEIIHNLVTVLIGPDGRVADLWRRNEWTVREVLDAIEKLPIHS